MEGTSKLGARKNPRMHCWVKSTYKHKMVVRAKQQELLPNRQNPKAVLIPSAADVEKKLFADKRRQLTVYTGDRIVARDRSKPGRKRIMQNLRHQGRLN